jgi:hypothetical protein
VVADVEWRETNQIREGYACGSVCAGGKTRAFHLAVLPADAIRPQPMDADILDRNQLRDASEHRPLVLNSQRSKFSAYPAEQAPYLNRRF